jgi:hypothetical protein
VTCGTEICDTSAAPGSAPSDGDVLPAGNAPCPQQGNDMARATAAVPGQVPAELDCNPKSPPAPLLALEQPSTKTLEKVAPGYPNVPAPSHSDGDSALVLHGVSPSDTGGVRVAGITGTSTPMSELTNSNLQSPSPPDLASAVRVRADFLADIHEAHSKLNAVLPERRAKPSAWMKLLVSIESFEEAIVNLQCLLLTNAPKLVVMWSQGTGETALSISPIQFVAQLEKYWKAIQPQWRAVHSREAPQGAWSPLCRTGPHGLLMFARALWWWEVQHGETSFSPAECHMALINDVAWVCGQMVAAHQISDVTVGDAPADPSLTTHPAPPLVDGGARRSTQSRTTHDAPDGTKKRKEVEPSGASVSKRTKQGV